MRILVLLLLISIVGLWLWYRYRRRLMFLDNPLPPQTEDLRSAGNSMTDPVILTGLGQSSHRSIRQLVASNSNTPIDVLIRLAVEFSDEVAANPSFGILLLENPNFIGELRHDLLMAILEYNSQLPEVFIDGAARHRSSDIPAFVLDKFQLSERQLERLMANTHDRMVADKIIFMQQNCTDRLRLIAARSGDKHLQSSLLEYCFSRDPASTIELLETLIDHATIDVQLEIFRRLEVTAAQLDRLFAPTRSKLQLWLVGRGRFRSQLSSQMQMRLVRSQLLDIASEIKVRQSLARAKWVDRSVLDILSRDAYPRVRGEVAKRQDLTPTVIWQLAADTSDVVRNGLVKNKSIDPATLIEMSQHPDIRVRQLAARHRNTPPHILAELARESALQTLVIRNHRTSIDLLRQLAQSGEHDIALTQNPHTPADILQPILTRLAIDSSYTIRKLVARHPHTPTALLWELAKDLEIKVSRIARSRLGQDVS
jgi:hypothetical protein